MHNCVQLWNTNMQYTSMMQEHWKQSDRYTSIQVCKYTSMQEHLNQSDKYARALVTKIQVCKYELWWKESDKYTIMQEHCWRESDRENRGGDAHLWNELTARGINIQHLPLAMMMMQL